MEGKFELHNIVYIDLERAEETVKQMRQILDKYGIILVSDYYKIIGKESNYADTLHGWTNIGNVTFSQEYDGWIIKLPEPQNIDVLRGMKVDKMVDHPNHYQSEKGIEVIDVMEAFTSDLEGIEAVDTAQVLKYICRWKKKNGLQDLNKAKWYLTHLINHIENNKKENE